MTSASAPASLRNDDGSNVSVTPVHASRFVRTSKSDVSTVAIRVCTISGIAWKPPYQPYQPGPQPEPIMPGTIVARTSVSVRTPLKCTSIRPSAPAFATAASISSSVALPSGRNR